MRIKRLSLVNVGPYRGPHELLLGAGAYAVVARYDGDPSRSNYAGKTSLFEAVDLALYGRHRHRTEDEWISDGEELGVVELETDDGCVVSRSRTRGKPTRLSWGIGQAKGDEAQREIVRHLGLDHDDYVRTCRVEQRQVARFVLARPEERMATVSGWLGLGPLEAAEEHVAERARALSAGLDQQRARATALEEQLAAVPEGERDADERDLEVADVELAQATAALALGDRQRETKRLLAERQALVDEGVRLRGGVSDERTRDLLARDLYAARDERKATGAALTRANDAYYAQVPLAQGVFDGRCPIAGIECPARDRINDDAAAARARLAVLQKECVVATDADGAVDERVVELEENLREHDAAAHRLAALREQVLRLNARIKAVYEPGDPPSRDGQEERVLAATGHRQRVAVDLGLRERVAARRAELVAAAEVVRAEVGRLERALATHREAQQVLGKQGAQRRVAEPALARIRDDADALLADAGVDLRVLVEWSREGRGLAAACDQCGEPYPASRRARECARCGAARGQQLVNKLEVRPSRVSGGAEDLVGAAFQLAASAWLRAQRGARWSCALLDEPFSQLDEANRRALARQLARLVGGRLLLEQSLVVSHAADTNCFAGTVLVESDGKWARARVL